MYSCRNIAVALTTAVVLAWGVPAASQTPTQGDPDLAFIDAMIAHHQEAIDAARALAPKAKRPEVKRLIGDIIRTQQAEVDQLRAWRRAWFQGAPAPAAHGAHRGGGQEGAMPGHMTGSQGGMGHGMMGGQDARADADLAFIEMMIPHHRDAVAMSREILNRTRRPELQQLAQGIISGQEKEIEMMERWRREWSQGTK